MAKVRCKNCATGRRWTPLGWVRSQGYELDQDWMCSRPCLALLLRGSVARSLDYLIPEVDYQHRVRIGSILVQRGVITPQQLVQAIELQKACGGTIGSQIVNLGFCNADEVTAALSEQQGLPWVGTIQPQFGGNAAALLPRQLCKDFRVFPFDFDEREQVVFVAARSPIKIALVHLLRKMLELEVKAFIVTDGSFDRAFGDYLEGRNPADEVVLHCRRNSREIADQVLLTAANLGARKLRLVRYEESFWVRLGKRKHWQNCFVTLESPYRIAESSGQSLPEVQAVGLQVVD